MPITTRTFTSRNLRRSASGQVRSVVVQAACHGPHNLNQPTVWHTVVFLVRAFPWRRFDLASHQTADAPYPSAVWLTGLIARLGGSVLGLRGGELPAVRAVELLDQRGVRERLGLEVLLRRLHGLGVPVRAG